MIRISRPTPCEQRSSSISFVHAESPQVLISADRGPHPVESEDAVASLGSVN
jgi:hypothetical protein